MIPVEKSGHPAFGSPLHVRFHLENGQRPRLGSLWLTGSYSLNSVSPLTLGKTGRAMRYLGGATLLFSWEVGVLASGLVRGMIEIAGVQAG